MPHSTSPRIPPLLPADWGPVTHDAASAYPAGRDFVLNNWQTGDKRGMNGLGAILNHPALAKSFLTFNNYIGTANTLPKRVRELMILRLSWLRGCEYEFQQHVILGLRAGLTQIEIERIQQGPEATGWNPTDVYILRAVDELIANACISEELWHPLSQVFSTEQMMDLVFTVGCYEVLAMAFKSFNVPFDPGLDPMQPEVRARMQEQVAN